MSCGTTPVQILSFYYCLVENSIFEARWLILSIPTLHRRGRVIWVQQFREKHRLYAELSICITFAKSSIWARIRGVSGWSLTDGLSVTYVPWPSERAPHLCLVVCFSPNLPVSSRRRQAFFDRSTLARRHERAAVPGGAPATTTGTACRVAPLLVFLFACCWCCRDAKHGGCPFCPDSATTSRANPGNPRAINSAGC